MGEIDCLHFIKEKQHDHDRQPDRGRSPPADPESNGQLTDDKRPNLIVRAWNRTTQWIKTPSENGTAKRPNHSFAVKKRVAKYLTVAFFIIICLLFLMSLKHQASQYQIIMGVSFAEAFALSLVVDCGILAAKACWLYSKILQLGEAQKFVAIAIILATLITSMFLNVAAFHSTAQGETGYVMGTYLGIFIPAMILLLGFLGISTARAAYTEVATSKKQTAKR